MLLLNIFSDRLDNLVNGSDKENFITYRQNRYDTSPQLSVIGKNGVVTYFKIEKRAIERNRVASYFEIEKKMENANENTFDISFFY